jgi:ABC-type dipeptide/oligopeptide/nickel transport system ATPase component
MLIADEPTSALDVTVQIEVLRFSTGWSASAAWG